MAGKRALKPQVLDNGGVKRRRLSDLKFQCLKGVSFPKVPLMECGIVITWRSLALEADVVATLKGIISLSHSTVVTVLQEGDVLW
jgi:hypothetical protein